MEACQQQAKEAGYELEVRAMDYNPQEHVKMAEIILHYEYAIPMLNLVTDHQVRGFAK